ncbi:MAG: aspartate/glutamate racemase family protein [Acidobacteria bacterium]|nr:aspartate/glutamate racemase family protein [Acidobacteriota bacterium]
MHILVTDSGVGGLSVVAYAERFLRMHGFDEPVRLTFANAAPENDYGYNAMPSREVKLATFDRFLRNVTDRYAPDLIYVACNTLSVLLPDTPFFAQAPIPVRGIVETGVRLVLADLAADPRSTAMIFATQTTIDAGTYARSLEAQGIDASRIVSQACPGLADIISEDREGSHARAEIRRWVGIAIEKMHDRHAPVVACLACTHYGYRKDDFASAFADAGLHATVVNPNESAVGDLFDARDSEENRDVPVQFVTRYAIPDTTLETLSWFLGPISPKTVAALRGFVHVPDLF